MRSESGTAALDLLRRLQHRNDHPVALLLVDYRMPQMDKIDTLKQAMRLYPDAKRVLLTAYADTEAAIKGRNRHIERNPIRANLAFEAEKYPWSSAAAYQGASPRLHSCAKAMVRPTFARDLAFLSSTPKRRRMRRHSATVLHRANHEE
jgi:CheY-like chemotaxis protein